MIGILVCVLLGLTIYGVILCIKDIKTESEITVLRRKKELVDYERFKSRHQFLKDVFDLDDGE